MFIYHAVLTLVELDVDMEKGNFIFNHALARLEQLKGLYCVYFDLQLKI